MRDDRRKTGGADGVYFTYTEEKPIFVQPVLPMITCSTWKKGQHQDAAADALEVGGRQGDETESGELGSAVNAYIERIRADGSIVPSFNTFYEYMRDDYRANWRNVR